LPEVSSTVANVKPPICEVCGDRFAPAEGGLVEFVGDAHTEEFDQRSAAPGFVGHRPNRGWFCGEHVEQAKELSNARTLTEAFDDIGGLAVPITVAPEPVARDHPDRWLQRFEGDDPVCLSCEQAFVAETGGKAVFRVDGEGQHWNDRMRRGEVDGHRPYWGWFCNRHIGPAQLASDRLSRMEALRLLVPEGRTPLEYREHPDGVEVRADEFGEPSRAPFVPVDDEFSPLWEKEFEIAPRIGRDMHLMVAAAGHWFGEAFGADRLRSFGSASGRAGSYSSFQSGELSLFLIGSGQVGIIVQRRERTLLEIRATTRTPPMLAPDGEPLLERLTASAASTEIADLVDGPLGDLVAELAAPVADPFDLSPDLFGVALRGAQIVRGLGGGVSTLDWSLKPLDVGVVFSRLTELAGPLATLLGVEVAPDLVTTTKRSWNPMDGAQEPDCPYTDMTQRSGTAPTANAEVTVLVDEYRNHWNDDDVANVSASILVQAPDRTIRVSAGGSGAGAACTGLSLRRPVEPGTIELLADAFGFGAN
jgi:hypothetical protein